MRFRHNEFNIVQTQKHDECCKGCTLVSIDEWVVFRNAEGIGGGKYGEIGFTIGIFIEGTAQCRLKHTPVTQTRGATKECKLLGVYVNHQINRQPNGFSVAHRK